MWRRNDNGAGRKPDPQTAILAAVPAVGLLLLAQHQASWPLLLAGLVWTLAAVRHAVAVIRQRRRARPDNAPADEQSPHTPSTRCAMRK